MYIPYDPICSFYTIKRGYGTWPMEDSDGQPMTGPIPTLEATWQNHTETSWRNDENIWKPNKKGTKKAWMCLYLLLSNHEISHGDGWKSLIPRGSHQNSWDWPMLIPKGMENHRKSIKIIAHNPQIPMIPRFILRQTKTTTCSTATKVPQETFATSKPHYLQTGWVDLGWLWWTPKFNGFWTMPYYIYIYLLSIHKYMHTYYIYIYYIIILYIYISTYMCIYIYIYHISYIV